MGFRSIRSELGQVSDQILLSFFSFWSFRIGSGYVGFRSDRVSDHLISGSLRFWVILGQVGFFFVMFYFGSDWISDNQTLKLFSEIQLSQW
jgi:hypothetical protein